MIVAVVISQLVRGGEIQLLWTETLMIAMAHYFASRRFIRLPPEEIKRLVDEGYIELEARPLYLPSYSIRVLLIVSFTAVGIYLYLHGRLLEPQPLSILGVVFAYLLGSLRACADGPRLGRRQGLCRPRRADGDFRRVPSRLRRLGAETAAGRDPGTGAVLLWVAVAATPGTPSNRS